MPILVIGGAGQVAQALEAAAAGRSLLRVGRPAFDFDQPETLLAKLRELSPSLIVNAAAYTGVDKAETDSDAAWRANRDGPGLLAQYCAQAGIPLIHISTDYVFDGLKGAPYVETDPTGPTGVYGASKLAGEQAVLASGARAIILRTSWVYAETGKNFVLTMLNAAKKTSKLKVVADQRGCPTAAADLAAAILAIADQIGDGWRDDWAGIYHAAGSGETTWHGLARAVFAAAARHGFAEPTVEPIATADWPTPARRPPDSRLDCGKLFQAFGVRLPDWHASTIRTVDAILA
jgi:dTDP-4-dehydrorhamnose reductase